MNITELKTLIKGALTKDASVNFADGQAAAINALCEYYGITPEMSIREVRRALPSKDKQFEIIEEVLDEILPKELEDIMGQWATIKSFARNEEVKFTTSKLGKKRAMLSIVPGARGGLYKARRLDNKDMFISTRVYTAGVYVTLEDLLLGETTLGELMDNILKGITYQVYVDVVAALRTAKTMAPAANVASGEGLVTADFNRVVRVVSAYGRPVIMCFESFASKFNNGVANESWNPNVPVADLDDIRNYGRVQVYNGHPVVVLPNFIMNENTNAEWAFSEADCFIFPADVKPVVVAMQGEGHIEAVSIPSGGEEEHYHKIMGTALIFANNLGIYTDTSEGMIVGVYN